MNNVIDTRKESEISPYLQKPLRTFAEACRDIAATRQALRKARVANNNAPIHVVDPARALRRGGLGKTISHSA